MRKVNDNGNLSGLFEGTGSNGEQIIAINLEDYDFYELRDPKKLHTYVKERLKENIMTYVFWMRYSIVKISQG